MQVQTNIRKPKPENRNATILCSTSKFYQPTTTYVTSSSICMRNETNEERERKKSITRVPRLPVFLIKCCVNSEFFPVVAYVWTEVSFTCWLLLTDDDEQQCNASGATLIRIEVNCSTKWVLRFKVCNRKCSILVYYFNMTTTPMGAFTATHWLCTNTNTQAYAHTYTQMSTTD